VTRGQRRRRLSFSWWQQLLLTLLPLVLVSWFFGNVEPLLPELAMPLFIAGVASMFVTLRIMRLDVRWLESGKMPRMS